MATASPTEAIPAQRVITVAQPAVGQPAAALPTAPASFPQPQPQPQPQPARTPEPVGAAAKPRRGRRVWLLVVLAVLAGGAYAGWTLLQSAPTTAPGTPLTRVQVGQAAGSASGLTFTIGAPRPYEPSNALLLDRGDTAYESTMTISNGSGDVAAATRIVAAATVGGKAAPQIFDQSFLSTQQIAVGQQMQVPFRFRVPQGVTGPLSITVSESGKPTVTVTGTL